MNIFSKIFSPSKRAKNWRLFLFISILAIGSLAFNFDKKFNEVSEKVSDSIGYELPKVKEREFKLGLDLQGGTHLVYKANTENVPEEDRGNALEGVRDVIERRVNFFGVSEPIVQTIRSGDEHRIIVELAGVKDVSEAISLIGETPLLEFKEEEDGNRDLSQEEQKLMDDFNTEAEDKITEVVKKIEAGVDFTELVSEYSDDSAYKEKNGDMGWLDELSDKFVVASVQNLEIGETTAGYKTSPIGYEIYRLTDKRTKVDAFDDSKNEKQVRAAHILICHNESDLCESEMTKEEAYSKIKEIKELATNENFRELAVSHSMEPGAANTGGDLGWFARGAMIKPFEDTVFDNQEINTISYVVETKFGYHIIHKQEVKDITEYNVSRILVPILTKESVAGAINPWKNTELTGKYLNRASVQFNYTDNAPEVLLEFDSEGSDLFAQITDRNINKQVAIFLDGYPISAPVVNSKITGGTAVISGNFNLEEAKLLVQRLNAGALPVPISLVSQKTIGASLGSESVKKSFEAAMLGLIALAVFMLMYYKLPGLLAVLSLLIYGTLMMSIFKIWPVTLTVSGLAGFILSLGMAVDANILIFERLKEELKGGSPIGLAIENGFKRAWSSIRDGNISTLITCFILIQFTTSIVKGFALTLSLGIVVSMFSAVIITRNLLVLFSGTGLGKKIGLWK